MAETFEQRLKRVSEEQKTSLVVSQDSFRFDENGIYRHPNDLEDQIKKTSKALFRELLAREDVKKGVLLVGIPGSGKSTWMAENREPGAVYFDATLVFPKARRKMLLAILEAEKPAEAVVFKTPLYLCEERNNKRPEHRRVPEEVMWEMAAQLHHDPPSVAEGFSTITFVEPPE